MSGYLPSSGPGTVSFSTELQVCGLRTRGHVIRQGVRPGRRVTRTLVRCASQRLYLLTSTFFIWGRGAGGRSRTGGSAARSLPTSSPSLFLHGRNYFLCLLLAPRHRNVTPLIHATAKVKITIGPLLEPSTVAGKAHRRHTQAIKWKSDATMRVDGSGRTPYDPSCDL